MIMSDCAFIWWFGVHCRISLAARCCCTERGTAAVDSVAAWQVATGVVLLRAGAESGSPPVMHSFSEVTKVTFHDLSSQTIDAYIATGEPFDKAGGYGIQATAASFVSGIEGCYFNVVGFPAARFCQELLQWWPLE